jgi:hypothetical protein
MALSLPFFPLPFELRKEIWELVATIPRVINICVKDGAVTTCTEPHPLLHVCRESRTICLEQNSDKLQVKNGKAQLAVNFVRDFFFIGGDIDWPLGTFPSEHYLYQLERVVIQLGPTCYLSSLFSNFPQLQELWIFLEETPKQFYPSPASEFRRHCPLHHCDIFPHDYYQPWLPRQSRIPCPACLWAESFYDFEFPFLRFWGHFRVTLDSSLPMFPTVEQILCTRNPQIRCVRFHESLYDGDPKEFSRHDPVDWEALECCGTSAAACLIGNSKICTH